MASPDSDEYHDNGVHVKREVVQLQRFTASVCKRYQRLAGLYFGKRIDGNRYDTTDNEPTQKETICYK